MLNVGKLVGERSAQYYLDTVARGIEDYYLHAGEAPGMWYGSAAVELGLAGEVSANDLMALLRGVHPSTGRQLAQPQRSGERVWGFDLTFRRNPSAYRPPTRRVPWPSNVWTVTASPDPV